MALFTTDCVLLIMSPENSTHTETDENPLCPIPSTQCLTPTTYPIKKMRG